MLKHVLERLGTVCIAVAAFAVPAGAPTTGIAIATLANAVLSTPAAAASICRPKPQVKKKIICVEVEVIKKKRKKKAVATYDAVGHQTNFMQRQGFKTCTQVLDSCRRGASAGITGRLAYSGVCEDRLRICLDTGCWNTTNTGSVCGLRRR